MTLRLIAHHRHSDGTYELTVERKPRGLVDWLCGLKPCVRKYVGSGTVWHCIEDSTTHPELGVTIIGPMRRCNVFKESWLADQFCLLEYQRKLQAAVVRE